MTLTQLLVESYKVKLFQSPRWYIKIDLASGYTQKYPQLQDVAFFLWNFLRRFAYGYPKIQSGHYPELPFHTCSAQQEIVCVRRLLAEQTRRGVGLIHNDDRFCVDVPDIPQNQIKTVE